MTAISLVAFQEILIQSFAGLIFPPFDIISAVAVTPFILILYWLLKTKTGPVLIFILIAVFIGATVCLLLYGGSFIAGIEDIRWQVLVGFMLGYIVELIMILTVLGSQSLQSETDISISPDYLGLTSQVFAFQGLIELGLLFSVFFIPKTYIPVLATGFGVVLLNLVRQGISDKWLEETAQSIEQVI